MPLVTRQANQGNLFNQDTEPSNWLDGDLWSDTSLTPPVLKINNNGTAVIVPVLDRDTTVDFTGTDVVMAAFI